MDGVATCAEAGLPHRVQDAVAWVGRTVTAGRGGSSGLTLRSRPDGRAGRRRSRHSRPVRAAGAGRGQRPASPMAGGGAVGGRRGGWSSRWAPAVLVLKRRDARDSALCRPRLTDDARNSPEAIAVGKPGARYPTHRLSPFHVGIAVSSSMRTRPLPMNHSEPGITTIPAMTSARVRARRAGHHPNGRNTETA